MNVILVGGIYEALRVSSKSDELSVGEKNALLDVELVELVELIGGSAETANDCATAAPAAPAGFMFVIKYTLSL